MSRQEGPPRPEITDDQQRLFIDKVPELVPSYVGLVRDETGFSIDEDSREGAIINEARIEHSIGNESIGIERAEVGSHLSVAARVIEQIRPTTENVYVLNSRTYKIEDGQPFFRQSTGIFRGGQAITPTELLKIYNVQFIAPVLDEYARQEVEAGGPDARVFTPERLDAIMGKLEQLGPHTVAEPTV